MPEILTWGTVAASAFVATNSDNLLVANLGAKNDTNFYFLSFGATGTDYGQILIEPGPGFTNDNPWSNFEQR